MPRKFTVRDFKFNSYYHIYNCGANNYPIFHDDQDFETFLGYLSGYLTPPPSRDDLKITVEFQGKKITGVPRQPNNYYGDLKLLAYCLTPDDFHLLMYQDPDHVVAKFMQSVNTRYSMYFNKRHGRTGSPFQGKYKAMHVENEADLMLLAKYIHKKSWRDDGRSRSSYPDYLGQVKTDWLEASDILEMYHHTHPETSAHDFVKQFTEDDRIDAAHELGDLTLDH